MHLTKRFAGRFSQHPRRALTALCFLSVAALLSLSSFSHGALSTPASISGVRIGFQNKYKVGHWTPLWIDFSGVGSAVRGSLEVTMPDGEGQPSTYQFSDIEITPNASTALCYVKFGRLQSSLRIVFRLDDGTLIERQFAASEIPDALPTSKQLVVTLGNDVGVEQSLVMRSRRTNEPVESAICQTAHELPDLWLGYAGIDLLVVPTRHAMWRSDGDDIESRQNALVKWARLGGTVILSCGEFGDELLADGKPLADILPGRFSGVGFERETTAIEEFVAGEKRLDFAESDGAQQLAYSNLTEPNGTVLFSEGLGAGRHPAVVVGLVELGKVIFTAFDLDSDSLTKWSEQTELVRRLVDQGLGEKEGDEREQSGMTRYGFDDIHGQLRMAMGSFPGVRVMPFSIVALLVAAYVFCIGPLDYFFHRRFSKRFELTWVTFPLLVGAFCALAYYLTAGQGRAVMQLNRVAIVDVDSNTHDAIGNSWWYVFSPTTERISLKLDSDCPELPRLDDSLMMWDGLAGSGFGGMNGGMTSSQASSAYNLSVYRGPEGMSTEVDGVLLDVRSSRSFYSQWAAQFDVKPNESTVRLGIESELEGTVVNSLPFDLERCWLVYDRWVYQLGSLRSGQQKSLLGMRSRDLKSLLTQQEFIKGRYKMTPWNRDSTDVDSIVRMMMFYSAVRGESYTGLRHRYQNHVDYGLKLSNGRAILVGESEQAPVKLMNSDSQVPTTRSTTYYRLSIPVEAKR